MPDAVTMFSIFLALCAGGCTLSLLLPEKQGPVALAFISSLSAAALISSCLGVILYGVPFRMELWNIFNLGSITLEMDRLSALFLFITGIIFLPVSIYSGQYMKKYLGRYSMKSFGLYYFLLLASIALLLVSADVLSFLFSWEAMSILTYLLVNYKHESEENTRAGYLMLAMGEAGTLAVLIGFLILGNSAGSLEFASMRSAVVAIGAESRWAIFLLTFFGFSIKAGLVPGSIWLPKAHPAATGNVSAILSGVILNLGIYGIIKINSDILPITSTGPGIIVLVIGTLSAFIGILYATTENDIKKMLAHSSIENMGIITAGIGAGLVFSASGYGVLAGIAYIAALYHLLNHSLYKSLLFLCAGAVDSSVGGRDMDQLGGLIRVMPWTSLFFLAGALSIAALPPFNGFVSEWLTLQTMLRSAALPSTGIKIIFALCGAVLALTAALAVTCFVKSFGISFLGISRSKEAARATEVKKGLIWPMGLLALLCLLFGILPTYVIPILDTTVSPIVKVSVADDLVPPFYTVGDGDAKFGRAFVSEFHDLGAQTGRDIIPGRGLVVLHRGSEKNPVVFAMSSSYTIIVLLLILACTYAVVRFCTRERRLIRGPVWDGGVRHLLPQMTYTATGFSNPVRVIYAAIFRRNPSNEKEVVEEHFRSAIRNGSSDEYILDRTVFKPFADFARLTAGLLSRLHSGSVNTYAAYVLISLIIVLGIQMIFF